MTAPTPQRAASAEERKALQAKTECLVRQAMFSDREVQELPFSQRVVAMNEVSSSVASEILAPLLDRITAAEARAEEAERDRDALLAATNFNPGPLGDGLKRDVILTDIGGLRNEMVRARHAECRAEGDAMLWDMRMLEEWPGDTLLLRIWRQRKAATADRDRLADEVARLRGALDQIAKPILHMQREMPEGYQFDGRVALTLITPDYLQGIAARALTVTGGTTDGQA